MAPRELTATHWFASRLAVVVLLGVGALLYAAPDWLVSFFGSRERVHSVGLLAAFAVIASLWWEVSQLRVRMAETVEALHQLLYGKDYRRDREAIEILLAALESQTGDNARTAHEHLVRLTGQKFAQDPKVWRSWWEANKKTFERVR